MYDVVNKARSGDRDAFVRLMEMEKQALFKIARSYFREPMDVEDAVSQTVLDCWEHIGTLKKPQYFETWLIRILINNCNDLARSRRGCVELTEVPDTAAPMPEDFGELMDALSEKNRTVLTLYYAGGYRVREISRLTSLPVGTVTSRLKRGRGELAKILEVEHENRKSVV